MELGHKTFTKSYNLAQDSKLEHKSKILSTKTFLFYKWKPSIYIMPKDFDQRNPDFSIPALYLLRLASYEPLKIPTFLVKKLFLADLAASYLRNCCP